MIGRLRIASGWILGFGLIGVLFAAHGAPVVVSNDVPRLAFTNLYVMPIGPRGLEYAESIRTLAGRRVRFDGYMVRQASPIPYTLLLSPLPLTLHEKEYGLAEDLPPSAIHVFLRKSSTPFLRPIRGLLSVEGTLELGPREEGDGRISNARLVDAHLMIGTNVFPAISEKSGPTPAGQQAPGRETAGNPKVPTKN